ncbi:MAG: ABC transporter permease [Acidimicrobiales bacterium]|nr:ABC transporter permease [Acidimicrobiales bacterium]MDP6299552.1 ABC transporter permease [Acidimicrobiales bacterium]HJM28056.1 ABC transporter permease [Acidimicrobiales bacterium]HJM96597.1 ABC transporter permease [Acidimicrobiales bacterium]
MTNSYTVKGHSFLVGQAFVGRGLMRMRRLPSLMLPTIVMPIFFVVAFSGSFASVVALEGYGTDKAVNWMTAWAVLQGAAFSGLGGGGLTATDIENGFFDRLRTAPINPSVLLTGLVGYSICRAVIPTTAVLIVSFCFLGAEMPGGGLGFIMVYISAIGMAAFMSFFVLGIVFIFKSIKSLAIAQIVMFSTMFLSVGQAPLEAIEGWLNGVAEVNPISHVIRMCRQGFLGEVTWQQTQPGLIAMLCLIAGTAIWARICYRKVDI